MSQAQFHLSNNFRRMRECHAHLHPQCQTYRVSISGQRVTLSFSNTLHTLLYRLFTESCLSLELQPSIHWFYHSWKFPQCSQVPPVNHSLPSVITDSQICEQTFRIRPQDVFQWLGFEDSTRVVFQLIYKVKKPYGTDPLVAFPLNLGYHPQTLSVSFQKSNQRNDTINSSRTLVFQSCFSQIQPLGS